MQIGWNWRRPYRIADISVTRAAFQAGRITVEMSAAGTAKGSKPMVKIIYLILAHGSPGHLQRLVGALSSSACAFLVHIDKKVDISPYRKDLGHAVGFTRERIGVYWGDFSLVEAICVLIKEALEDDRKFDRFVLLSGTDYPVRANSYIADFFGRHPHTQFMDFVPMPSVSQCKPLSRLTDYQAAPATTVFSKLVREISMRLGIKPRQRNYQEVFGGLLPYAGSTWWALTREACEYIKVFMQEKSEVVNFFRNTVCPDEMFFQTILCNSIFASDIKGEVTFADWTAGGCSPSFINMDHVEMFRSLIRNDQDGDVARREILFARKFSEDSVDVVTAVDRLLLDKHERKIRFS